MGWRSRARVWVSPVVKTEGWGLICLLRRILNDDGTT